MGVPGRHRKPGANAASLWSAPVHGLPIVRKAERGVGTPYTFKPLGDPPAKEDQPGTRLALAAGPGDVTT
jgi:hypothetical protein